MYITVYMYINPTEKHPGALSIVPPRGQIWITRDTWIRNSTYTNEFLRSCMLVLLCFFIHQSSRWNFIYFHTWIPKNWDQCQARFKPNKGSLPCYLSDSRYLFIICFINFISYLQLTTFLRRSMNQRTSLFKQICQR